MRAAPVTGPLQPAWRERMNQWAGEVGGELYDTREADLLAFDAPGRWDAVPGIASRVLYRRPDGRYFYTLGGRIWPVGDAEALRLYEVLPRHLAARADAFAQPLGLAVRLAPGVYDALQAAAEAAGCSPSEWAARALTERLGAGDAEVADEAVPVG